MTKPATVNGLVSTDGFVARFDAPAEALASAAAGLPEGEALLEAIAVRLARSGWRLERGEPEAPPNRTALRPREGVGLVDQADLRAVRDWAEPAVPVGRPAQRLIEAVRLEQPHAANCREPDDRGTPIDRY